MHCMQASLCTIRLRTRSSRASSSLARAMTTSSTSLTRPGTSTSPVRSQLLCASRMVPWWWWTAWRASVFRPRPCCVRCGAHTWPALCKRQASALEMLSHLSCCLGHALPADAAFSGVIAGGMSITLQPGLHDDWHDVCTQSRMPACLTSASSGCCTCQTLACLPGHEALLTHAPNCQCRPWWSVSGR